MATNNTFNCTSFDDLLTDYVKGQMNSGQETAFLELLKSNPDYKTKAIAVARMVKVMDRIGNENDAEIIAVLKTANVDDIHRTCSQVCKISKKKSAIRLPLTFFSVAASLLICIFSGYKYIQYNRTTSLGKEYIAFFPSSDYQRGFSNGTEGELNGIYASIDRGDDLRASIDRLKHLWKESRSDTYNAYTAYMPQIGWMLANAYLCDNDPENATQVLKTLINESEPGSIIRVKATELLTKIEKI